MSFSLGLLFLVVLLLVFLSAFFSSAEIGVMSINRYRLRHLVKKKHKNAIRINKMLSQPDRLLSVILIGNTVCNIVASMAATLIGHNLYGEKGVLIATILLTIAVLVISEMTPKTFAALYPQKVAFTSALPLYLLQKLFSPIVNFISLIANKILLIFGVDINKVNKDTLSGDELRSVVHEAGILLPVEHKGMLLSLLDLEQATVEDIMIPKSDIIGVDLEQPWPKILEQLETIQHTRVPLYRDSIDNLVGIVHLRKVLNMVLDDELTMDGLLSIIEPPYFVPEATPLNVQIINFQNMKRRSCFVVNEYGDLQGLATMEDILEEIVGEFTTDISDLSKDITRLDEQKYIIDGGITVRNLNRILGWQLPLLGPKTLSGIIIEYLGYIPPADCCLQIDGYQIEVLKVADNTIKSALIAKSLSSQ